MLTKEEIYQQNMNDMNRIATILAEILKGKEELLTEEDNARINYCSTTMRNVREKEYILKENFK